VGMLKAARRLNTNIMIANLANSITATASRTSFSGLLALNHFGGKRNTKRKAINTHKTFRRTASLKLSLANAQTRRKRTRPRSTKNGMVMAIIAMEPAAVRAWSRQTACQVGGGGGGFGANGSTFSTTGERGSIDRSTPAAP